MIAEPPQVAAPAKGTNRLAVASLLVSLIFPIGVFLVLSDFTISGYFPTAPLLDVLNPVAAIFFFGGIAGAIAAIVTGHIALHRARLYPPEQARRAVAITGLVLGYVNIAIAVLALIVFAYLLLLVLSSL